MLKILVYGAVFCLGWYYSPQLSQAMEELFAPTVEEVTAIEPCGTPEEPRPITNIPQPITEKYTRSI